MGFFRFRKSIKILPGLKVNLNKKGISMTAGVRGMHCTIGKDRVNTTVGIPGTGLSYTSSQKITGSNQDSYSSELASGRRSPKVCPYCGHHMRKQWQFCPKCHGPLLLTEEQQQQLMQQQQAALAEQEQESPSSRVPSQTQAAGKGGCLTSCLMLVVVLGLLGLL